MTLVALKTQAFLMTNAGSIPNMDLRSHPLTRRSPTLGPPASHPLQKETGRTNTLYLQCDSLRLSNALECGHFETRI